MRETRRHERRALLLALAAAAAVLPGCAGLTGGPRTVDISEARLNALLARQFPHSQRFLDLFDVTLSTPTVRLMPADDRIGTELHYSLGASVLSERQMTGVLDLSYGLRFEPADATVRLTAVRVERFDLAGLPKAYATRVPQLGRLLAQNLLQDLVIHRFDGADLRRVQQAGLQPGALKVVPGGLQLRLDPVAP